VSVVRDLSGGSDHERICIERDDAEPENPMVQRDLVGAQDEIDDAVDIAAAQSVGEGEDIDADGAREGSTRTRASAAWARALSKNILRCATRSAAL